MPRTESSSAVSQDYFVLVLPILGHNLPRLGPWAPMNKWARATNYWAPQLFYYIFLSPLPQISLSPSSLFVTLRLYLISSLSITLYLFPLLLAQESCSRSLSRPRCDLAALFFTTCHQSHCLILQPSPSTSIVLTTDLQISLNRVVGVRFGMVSM